MNTIGKTFISPCNLIQEQFRNDEWKLFVICIMMNKTKREQVDKIHEYFFDKYPNEYRVMETDLTAIAEIIKPTGMHKMKAENIMNMSQHYIYWNGKDPRDLPSIGNYGYHSWMIFYKNNVDVEVKDIELKRYLDWYKKNPDCNGNEKLYGWGL